MGINCFKCSYFIISWDKNSPYGCRKFNFKSKKLPSKLVKESSGLNCQSFSYKQGSTASFKKAPKTSTINK